LTDLVALDVSTTHVTGTVPSELSRLTKLSNLRVFDSNMSGSVPSSVCDAFRSRDANAGIVVDCDRVACDCNCTCA
jgi:hypothetical protein